MSAVDVAGLLAGDPEDFLDQYLSSGGFNYLSQLPLDITRHMCTYLEPRDVRALALTCRRLAAVASDDLWRDQSLAEFWSARNGKPPVSWALYYRHWWSVTRFWQQVGLAEMSFAYPHGTEWTLFTPDRNAFVVCESAHGIVTTKFVNLLKAKTYTLDESNESTTAGANRAAGCEPLHAWSKHILALEDASHGALLYDITEGHPVAPVPRLADPAPDRPAHVSALLFVGHVLVLGYNTGALRAFRVLPSAPQHPAVALHGPASTHAIDCLSPLDPGRFAALTLAGIRVWTAERGEFRCTQVIDVAPLALDRFIRSTPSRFVSCAGRCVQTWELASPLKVAHKLDLSAVTRELVDPIRIIAADDVHALVSSGDQRAHLLRLQPLQYVHCLQLEQGARIVAISLDGPLAALACDHAVVLINVYTHTVVRQIPATNPRWVSLNGKEMAVVELTHVRVWREHHVLPNKRMRVEVQGLFE